ncbi:MAG TPA: toll/interleukin-1 receptor domain-containing protein [Chthoniobacterales bacterium]|nr:toll/interleukin-1 receptor domain-containing protein [Chthoniobacterales bacterium]
MIAISYRRQDSSPVAGRLYDRLQAEFGKGSVFMDFDSIPYGVDFREHIKQTLQRAKVVVAIIGPEWCGGREPANRRIDDPTDFVRLEVASALEHGIPIIPVLINNTPMPEAKNLPPELEGLAFRNGLALDTGIDFHHHADRLIAGIHRVVDPPKAPEPPAPLVPQTSAAPAARKPSKLLPVSIAVVALAGIAAWYFSRRPNQATTVHEVVATTPAPAAASPAATSSPPAIAVASPTAMPMAAVRSPAAATSGEAPPTGPGRVSASEQVFTGKIGAKEATFRLRFEPDGRVTGTYSQSGSTYRLEGRRTSDKLLLDEFTGERITAHLDLARLETGGASRWEGTMRNTPPDKRVLAVFFESGPATAATSQPPAASNSAEESGTTGEYSYRGKVGPYDASFQLRFEPSGRVSGTYTLSKNTSLVLRLEGRNPKGRLFLDEYTHDRLSARIELSLIDSASDIRWEGTMYNTPPDNRVFPVSFSRPRK